MDESTEYIVKRVREGFYIAINKEPQLDRSRVLLRRGDLSSETIVYTTDIVESDSLLGVQILKRMVEKIETMESATNPKHIMVKESEHLRIPRDNFISYTEGCKK